MHGRLRFRALVLGAGLGDAVDELRGEESLEHRGRGVQGTT